jgi:hypothetical protein
MINSKDRDSHRVIMFAVAHVCSSDEPAVIQDSISW